MMRKRLAAALLALLMMAAAGCSTDKEGPAPDEPEQPSQGDEKTPQQQSSGFAAAHDAFQTKLAREESDDDEVPAPPEGLFDLVKYPSKAGDLAAYVSSDPGDGQKHPMIIWVVGGWGNGIDEFPWTYPAWDNDQTGSAFWQAGVLTMYPSFRGGVGNPGNYEALFGEVDDIASAYEYAASLPYVDPDRIYLGGHSTGATRALLAAEYTDKFRAVFCFGPVDEVKYHNNTQFTFDTSDEPEFKMRSPIHWLEDVKNPVFLIEGSEGNGDRVKNIQNSTDNENIRCFVLEGEDHFSPLAPITRLAAQKILADTGAEVDITLTQEELEQAMAGQPEIPLPAMSRYRSDDLGVSFEYPYIWQVQDTSDGDFQLTMYSQYEEDNVWDMSSFYFSAYQESDAGYLEGMAEFLEMEGYQTEKTEVSGAPAILASGQQTNDNGSVFNNRFLLVQKGDTYMEFDFYIHEDFGSDADPLFQAIVDSVALN